MTKKTLVAAIIAACAGTTAVSADTLYLSNGTSVSGSVVKNPDGIYVLSVDGRQVMYRANEVAKYEQNSLTGLEFREQASEVAVARERERVQATGLSEEDRVYVDRKIQSIRAADAAAKSRVVEDLTEFGAKVDLVRFLETMLPSLSPSTYPYVLEVFCKLAPPAKAEAMLSVSATHLSVPIRSQSLRLMGKVGSDQCIELLGRGLVDPNQEVQLAAIEALGELKAKRATPALIEFTGRGLEILTKAAERSLVKIWETTPNLADNSDGLVWNKVWSEHKSLVGAPIDLRTLRPLVDPKEQFVEG